MRGLAFALAVLVALPAASQDVPSDAEPAPAADAAPAAAAHEAASDYAAALQALVDVERAVLDSLLKQRLANLESQRTVAIEQARATSDAATAARALSRAALAGRDVAAARDVLGEAESALRRANAAAAQVVSEGDRLSGQVATAASRLSGLVAAVEQARERGEPTLLPPLQGAWDVVMAPSGDRGVFKLAQTGTLVGGTYTMTSGRLGSFQGTFVDDRVRLERVDSKSGRDLTFYALLARDGLTLKGSWESQVLGTGEPAFGTWTAVKRVPQQ